MNCNCEYPNEQELEIDGVVQKRCRNCGGLIK
jgi:hypothetical protein